MWQLEMAATNASSGSTLAGLQYCNGTTAGDADAGTVKPPSKDQVCSRVYLPSRNSGEGAFHSIFALCCDMWIVLLGDLLHARKAAVVGPGGRHGVLQPAARAWSLDARPDVGEGAALPFAPAGVATQHRLRRRQIEAAIVVAGTIDLRFPLAAGRRGRRRPHPARG